MRRRAVKIEVILFDILTMVAFAIRQSEETLFENWIVAIPQSHTKAEQLLLITDTGKAVLTPVVSAGTGLVVGEVVPGISILAVVLPNRAPLALAKVRPPLSPLRAGSDFFESLCFCIFGHSIFPFRTR